jgi:flagellar protein FlbD
MITLHRLGIRSEELHLNPDLITTVEAHPDTVITLATGSKVVVSEAPEEIAEAVREWRAAILDEAWRRRHAAV